MGVTTRISNKPGRSTDRSPYRYTPREPVEVHSTGISVVDHYLQQDCVLTPEELRRLATHKYSAVDTSWLDELCMKAFWENVVTVFPLWVAPNLITLVGLIINLCTVLVLSHYSPMAIEDAPRWAYLLAALGLFAYQTLDAIDGKQARRTGSNSPLGELFDHGCDSVSQVFITLNVCYAMQLGSVHTGVFSACVMAVVLFYAAHWSTYCTGQLRFARFDVTEAQMCVILCLLGTAIFGPKVWSIGVLGFQLKHVVLGVSSVLFFYQLGGYLNVVMNEGIGKNGSTVAGTSVLFPVCPLLAAVIPFAMMYSKSNSDVFDERITTFTLFFGAVAAKATNRLIVAHMCRSELMLWDWIYLGPLALILNQYYDFVFSESRLLLWATIYCYISLIVYCVMITRQICIYLNIQCFKISSKQQ